MRIISVHKFLFLVYSYLGVLGLSGVHLVDTNDKLLDTEGVSQQSVLTGLSILRDTGFKFTSTSSDDQHGTISLEKKDYQNHTVKLTALIPIGRTQTVKVQI